MKEPNNQAFMWPRYKGVYFVKYINDGTISGLMNYNTAQDYAEIFGGKVHKHSRARKWWQFWKPLLDIREGKENV